LTGIGAMGIFKRIIRAKSSACSIIESFKCWKQNLWQAERGKAVMARVDEEEIEDDV
jgi:hypothetical protein